MVPYVSSGGTGVWNTVCTATRGRVHGVVCEKCTLGA